MMLMAMMMIAVRMCSSMGVCVPSVVSMSVTVFMRVGVRG